MKSQAVIGLGFGDEGKGKVVSYLCSLSIKPLVIRFSGGHQAGHQVVITDAFNHVFSNFGSGTLQGIDTYWSKFCTVEPVGLLNELTILIKKGVRPKLYIDGKCPITTPYDIAKNRENSETLSHGTCGIGFGQTIQREEDKCSLLFCDLFDDFVLRRKIDLIKDYYHDILIDPIEIIRFVHDCVLLTKIPHYIKKTREFPENNYSNYIFEGSQGLLLDQDIGFFPHVTRANTGTKNILELGYEPEIFLVTRTYQTRHGNGPMTNENIPHKILDNPYEKNTNGGTQGEFRITPLDLELLKYGTTRDRYIREAKHKNIVITCVDLIQEQCEEKKLFNQIKNQVGANKVFVSRSPLFNDIEQLKNVRL